MSKFEIKLRRFRTFVLGSSSKTDLDQELRYHVEMLTVENITAGMSAKNAKAEALRRFGNIERIKSQCRGVHRGSLPGAARWTMGIVVVFGAFLWATSHLAQVSVLGQMLVITVVLCRLLVYLRAWPALTGSSASHASELSIFEATPMRGGVNIKKPQHLYSGLSPAFAESQGMRIIALGAAIVCCLCVVVIASSAKAFSNHLRHSQEKGNGAAEKFVGTWVLAAGDIYYLKDTSLPAPFRNLPQGLSRNLPLAEVSVEVRSGNITGKRRLYSYASGTNSGSPVVEKDEVDLVNIHAEANVLSGSSATPEGERVPGDWEMKLTGEKEVEVRVTGDDVPEEQKKLVLKLHRPRN
jgi:hypothetical protein